MTGEIKGWGHSGGCSFHILTRKLRVTPCLALLTRVMPPLVLPEETIPLSSECTSLLPAVLPQALCMPSHELSSLQANVWDRVDLTQLEANLLFYTHEAYLVVPGRNTALSAEVQVRSIPQFHARHCGTKLRKCSGTSAVTMCYSWR